MEFIFLSLVWFIVFGNCLYEEENRHILSTLKIRNKRSVRQRAFNRACATHTCHNLKCTNEDGWYLYGSDWGCCGNYDGCCNWASSVCYYHDALCKCCTYGWLVCGPDCKPEAECFEKHEENTNEIYEIFQPSKNKSERTVEDIQSAKSEKNKSDIKKMIAQNEIVKPKSKSKKFNKHKKYFKPKNMQFNEKLVKTMNAMSGDELFMADQPIKEDIEDGSGEND